MMQIDEPSSRSKVNGASHNRHASKQDYQTPPEFIAAVESRFGAIRWDLAADATNAKADRYYAAPDDKFVLPERRDALAQDWARDCGSQLCWLNPEFGNITPFAEKCAFEVQRGCRILMLTPASVGSDWFHRHVVPYAHVIELSPRMSFDGKHPFPKDLILSVYMHGLTGRSYWRWKP